MTDTIENFGADDYRLALPGETIGVETLTGYALVTRSGTSVAVIEGSHDELEQLLLDTLEWLHVADHVASGRAQRDKEQMRAAERGELPPF